MAKERNYGIDLLRLVLMYMVCMLHTLGQGGVLSASAWGTGQHYVFWFLEILSYCAVNAFAMISGYVAVDRPRKFERLADMWFQAVFYSFVVTMILTIAGLNGHWGVGDMIRCIMPVTFNKFWYFTAFFALYFAIPVLNPFLFSIEEKTAKKTFYLMVVLFSVLGTIGDPFKSGAGYSAIWLIVLYCIGVLAKRTHLMEKRSTGALILGWAGCILVTWALQVFLGSGFLTNYLSPTILYSGLIMVVLFSRIRVKGTILVKITPLVFGIYLFQLNQVIWDNLLKGAFAWVVNLPLGVGVLVVFGLALAIFVSGLVVEAVRSALAKLMRIHVLCEKIVRGIDRVLEKV